MPPETGRPGEAGDLPAFADAAGCKAWLEQLLLSSVPECHAAILAQVERLPRAPLTPAVKLELLEILRETVALVQSEHARRYRGKPVPLDAEEQAAWRGVVGLWGAMGCAYEALLEEAARAAPGLAAQVPLICQRALRCTASAMAESARAYQAVGGALWRQLHRLHVFAETAGIEASAVQDGLGRTAPATSCMATYARALLAHLAQPDALTLQQMELAERWLDRWEGLLAISAEPAPAGATPALAVDVASSSGAGLARQKGAGSGIRHLHPEPLARALRQAALLLRQGADPAQLGAGDVPREDCEKLLAYLHVQWCAAGTGRIDERVSDEFSVTVFPGIAAIHGQLAGQPRGVADGEPGKEPAPETWTIVNRSVSGFLGLRRGRAAAMRVGHGQLLGLRPPNSADLYLGVVQRLIVDEEDAIWAGLRLIAKGARPVSARVLRAESLEPATGTSLPALIVADDPAHRVVGSIVLPPRWYQASRILSLHSGKNVERVRLRALLDAGPNFDRATYAVIQS